MATIYTNCSPLLYDTTTHLLADRRRNGTADIVIGVEKDGEKEIMVHHNLSIAEADKFGAALCKDIIDNYTRHAANLRVKIADLEDADREMRYRNTNLSEQVVNLKYKNATLARTAFEHDNEQASTIDKLHEEVAGLSSRVGSQRDTIVSMRGHNTEQMWIIHKIDEDNEELEARNKELETKNIKLEQCIGPQNLFTSADIGVPVYGMRDKNFEQMVKGYHGTLSRHGKTIVITLPFEHETVAINAVEYITGHDEHTNHNAKED